MKIYLDDQAYTDRIGWAPKGWVIATNPEEFKKIINEAVEKGDSIEAIDFDNDLGKELEGKHLLNWLIDNYPEIAIEAELLTHTENIAAKKELLGLIRDCKEHPQEILEKKKRPSYEDLFSEGDKIK